MGARKENGTLDSLSRIFDDVVQPALEDRFHHPYPYLLKPLKVVDIKGRNITVETAKYASTFVADHFGEAIKEEIAAATGHDYSLKIVEGNR